MITLYKLSTLLRQLRTYEPLQLSIHSFVVWLKQFHPKDWILVFRLLSKIDYYSRARTIEALVELNKNLLDRLRNDGLSSKEILYMSIHEAGSSSHVMLNLLRDHHRLVQKGLTLVDSTDIRKVSEIAQSLERCAIIYVDDFSGTGNQFISARSYIADYLPLNVSEFFLLPVICEEAKEKISLSGVEPIFLSCHSVQERPLHPGGKCLSELDRATIQGYSKSIDENWGLGYRNAATMVVFYRNAPNSTPLIFRGSKRQKPWKGIMPRFDDLP